MFEYQKDVVDRFGSAPMKDQNRKISLTPGSDQESRRKPSGHPVIDRLLLCWISRISLVLGVVAIITMSGSAAGQIAPMTEQQYRERAYLKAFGDDGADWVGSKGFRANRSRILKLYDYYRDLYNQQQDAFLWAGLARLAGGSVVGGLDYMTGLPFSDPAPISNTMVEIGRVIFDDLAWLHEAFLDNPLAAIALAAAHDVSKPARRSYAQAITQIASRDPAQIAAGNRALLENEQYTIIQPFYDRLRNSPEYGVFRLARTATSNVHPYHKDFLASFPTTQYKDITVADHRWEWIVMPGGMWEKWAEGFRGETVGASVQERRQLVNLPFDKIMRRDFAPLVPRLVPPGTQF